LTSGSHLSDAAIRVGWLPRAAPCPRIKCAVKTTRRRPDSAALFRPRRHRYPNCLARPVLTAPLPLSEAAPPPCLNPAAVRPSDAVTSFIHDESHPSSPLAVLRPWSVELTFPSLLTVAGPSSATVAPPRRKNASAKSDFFPSPSTRSPMSYFPLSHVRRAQAVRCAHGPHPRGRGPRTRCARGSSRCRERGPSATVKLGRSRFRPSDTRNSFPNF
jgi:hypothetical protein